MISVALCTYNGKRFIKEQLKSIISQTTSVDEIIICDDKSTDGTVQEIYKFRESVESSVNIRVFVNSRNYGVTKNFEKAISLCRGDIIFLADQDDVWLNNKVSSMITVFDEDEKCQLVFTDAALVDSDMKDTGRGLWELTHPYLKEKYVVSDFTGHRFVTGATVAFRRDLLAQAIPIPDCWIHDAWLAVIASQNGNIKYIDQKLVFYRQHEKNVVGAKKRSILKQIQYTSAHIDRSIRFKTTMRERFSSLFERIGSSLSDTERQNLLRCLAFWKESETIFNCPVGRGLSIIIKNTFNGNYSKYNHGVYGGMVDLFILLRQKL